MANFKIILRSGLNSLKEFPIYSRFFMEVGAWVNFAVALISFSLPTRLQKLSRAYSLAQSEFTISLLARVLSGYLAPSDSASPKPDRIWEKHRIGWERYDAMLNDTPAAARTLILKSPGANGEKGVMVAYFEYNWLRILSGVEPFEGFDDQYSLVLYTSWSPTNYNILALALEKISGPVFVVPCNHKEVDKLKRFHPRIRPLNFLPCDWLNPDFYQIKPWQDRDIDIILISNWAPFKRHWHFFDIMRKLPADLRIVCVGQPEGKFDLAQIRELQEFYGVPQQIEFLERIPIEKVCELQCNSKIALILSRREGCCVAAAEGIMAGAYLGILHNAHVGPLAYINEETGVRLEAENAHLQIMNLLNKPPEVSPHQWAKNHISYRQSAKKLSESLLEAAAEAGLPWTEEIALPCWRPYPCFVDGADEIRLRPTAESLSASYPAVFPVGWMEKSSL